MRPWIIVAAVCCVGWACAGEEFEITAIEKNGTLPWDSPGWQSGEVYHVEWASSPNGPWHSSWGDLLGIVATGPTTTVEVPMFYRVMAEPAQIEDDYMVIDLSAGPSASSYPVSYLSAVPSGGWSDEYKTTKLVLRRIPAGTFTMGSPEDELGRGSGETQHQVTLTQDFYIGVFEVTQKQWERVMGSWPSYFSNVSYRDARPVERVSYNMIRGSSAGAGWPADNDVDADSFMGRLRERTGRTFDLPTESQWEYACRAGTTTALNSGTNLTSTRSCPRMAEVGRYYYNHPGGYSSSASVSTDGGTAKVGSYLANAWGLYDMHVNVWEWSLDWYGTYPGTVTDPRGATTGSYRVLRGGSRYRGAGRCRSADRYSGRPDGEYDSFGFRAAAPPGQ